MRERLQPSQRWELVGEVRVNQLRHALRAVEAAQPALAEIEQRGAGGEDVAGQLGSGRRQQDLPAMASGQFWLANVGLPGMLAGSVLPVGLGLDRVGVLFGFLEAAAGVLFALLLSRALRNS